MVMIILSEGKHTCGVLIHDATWSLLPPPPPPSPLPRSHLWPTLLSGGGWTSALGTLCPSSPPPPSTHFLLPAAPPSTSADLMLVFPPSTWKWRSVSTRSSVLPQLCYVTKRSPEVMFGGDTVNRAGWDEYGGRWTSVEAHTHRCSSGRLKQLSVLVLYFF